MITRLFKSQKQNKSSFFCLGYVLINVGQHAETESLIKSISNESIFFGNTCENISSSNGSWGKMVIISTKQITFRYLLSHT